MWRRLAKPRHLMPERSGHFHLAKTSHLQKARKKNNAAAQFLLHLFFERETRFEPMFHEHHARLSMILILGTIFGGAACSNETSPAKMGTGGSGSGGMPSGTGGATMGTGGLAAGSGGTAAGSGGNNAGSGGASQDASGDAPVEAPASSCKTDPGYALQFRGTGDDRVHADVTKLPINGESRTIELWAYFEDSNLSWHTEHGLFEYGMKGGCHEFGLNSVDWPANQAQGMIHPYGNCGEVDNFFNLPAGTPRSGWIHFSFGYDSQAKQFHFTINGNEMLAIGTGAAAARGTHAIGAWPADSTFSTMKSPLRIGTTDDFAGPPGWQGKIDELRVWNIYRTADDIKRDMKVMLKGNEAGLVAYYKFDEGTGQTSADATGDTSNAAKFVGADKMTWPMWGKSDVPGPFTCAP